MHNPSSSLRRTSLAARVSTLAIVAGLSLLPLMGCETLRDPLRPDLSATVDKPTLPEKDAVLNKSDNSSVINVPISDNVLTPQALEYSQPLPKINIPRFNATDASIFQSLRLLLDGTGISVTADPDVLNARISTIDMHGSLAQILDNLSETAGIFYTYRNNNLRISNTRNFVVQIPPLGDGFASLVTMIENMGGENVAVDNQARMISFRANRRDYDTIKQFLDNIRRSKVLIVMETYFFEVTLSDSKQVGINWAQFNADFLAGGKTLDLTTSGGQAVNAIAGGVSFGTVYSSGDLSINNTVSFLQTQGNVEILSKPVITIVSGGTANFEVGGQTRFVSEVGTTVNNNVSTTTFSTEDLRTGLNLTLAGDFHDDTIFTNVTLDVTNLVDFDEFNFNQGGAGGETTVRLPETATRKLTTTVRARPGDTILIAGINETRDTANEEGLPFMDRLVWGPTRSVRQVERSELVIIMQPRVLRFVPSSDKREPQVAATVSPLPTDINVRRQPRPAFAPEETQPQAIITPPAPASKKPAVKAEPLTPPSDQPESSSPPQPQPVVPSPAQPKSDSSSTTRMPMIYDRTRPQASLPQHNTTEQPSSSSPAQNADSTIIIRQQSGTSDNWFW